MSIVHQIDFYDGSQSSGAGWNKTGDLATVGLKLSGIDDSNINLEVITPFTGHAISGALIDSEITEVHGIPRNIFTRFAEISGDVTASIKLSGFLPSELIHIYFFGLTYGADARYRVAVVDGQTYQNNNDSPDGLPTEPTLIETSADTNGEVDVVFGVNPEDPFALFGGIIVEYNISTDPAVTTEGTLTSGESATISTSNFEGAITGARITDNAGNVKEITLDSPTQVSLPALGTQSYCLFGDVTLEVYNATESAMTTVAFDPPASHPYLVTLTANPENLTETGYLFNWNPDAGYEGAQVISPVPIDNQGNWLDVPEGTHILYGIDDLDGMMQEFAGIFEGPGGGDPDPDEPSDPISPVLTYRGRGRVRKLAQNATEDIVGSWITASASKAYGFVAQGEFGGATVRFEEGIIDTDDSTVVLAQDTSLSFTSDSGLVTKKLPEGIRVRPIIENSGVNTNVSIYLTV